MKRWLQTWARQDGVQPRGATQGAGSEGLVSGEKCVHGVDPNEDVCEQCVELSRREPPFDVRDRLRGLGGPPDANCVTTPDGGCVGGPCMHDERSKEQTVRTLIVRLHDAAFQMSANPLYEEAAVALEGLLEERKGLVDRRDADDLLVSLQERVTKLEALAALHMFPRARAARIERMPGARCRRQALSMRIGIDFDAVCDTCKLVVHAGQYSAGHASFAYGPSELPPSEESRALAGRLFLHAADRHVVRIELMDVSEPRPSDGYERVEL